MGTSQSSSGSPSGVPLVPPWVSDPIPPADLQDNGQEHDGQSQVTPVIPVVPTTPQVVMAPPRRFGPARVSLGRFAASGSSDDMRRGIGHYIGKGLGGGSAAARRFGGTTQTAGTLYGALSSVAAGQPSTHGRPLDPVILSGRTADEVMDAVVEAVRPIDGTQDTEASRSAIRTALSELLERFPDADLLSLSEDQRLFAIERYLTRDVFSRLSLDVGKAVYVKAPNASAALSRLRDILNYVRETIAAKFRALRNVGKSLSAHSVAQMGTSALREAFEVFEEYVR